MNESMLIFIIILPLLVAALMALIPNQRKVLLAGIAVLGSALTLVQAGIIFFHATDEWRFVANWIGHGIDFSLRADLLAGFILLAVNAFGVLLALYTAGYSRNPDKLRPYYSYFFLLLGSTNGAVLANNFIVLILFLGTMLPALYGIIRLGGADAEPTARKALIIAGVVDFMMMLGIILLSTETGTFSLSAVHADITGVIGVAFILMATAAMAKAGAMPFHTWIPDAAVEAPLPFMAFLPAALEKLLGIYLLVRVSLHLFVIPMGSAFSLFLMTMGSI
ncbi:MAG TPA: proton-conducting transporter membrane subunit, partial [bacterium]|nr:proton-conducting transporter membrane subunit [bacterium]